AKLAYTVFPGAVAFKTDSKDELKVKLGTAVRYVDHEGKEMAQMEASKFFNVEDVYAVKLRMEAGEDVPVLYEARLTPPKGELPVFLKDPLGRVGAKRVKNAVVKLATIDDKGRKRTVHQLVVEGQDPVSFLFNQTETKAYDNKGESAAAVQILQPGMKVDAV